MTKQDLVYEIYKTVEFMTNNKEPELKIRKSITSLINTLEPKDKEKFAQWGYDKQKSNVENCWKD